MAAWQMFLEAAAAVGPLCAVVFGYALFARNRRTDDRSRGAFEAQIVAQLEHVRAVLAEVRDRLERNEACQLDLVARMAAAEAHAGHEPRRRRAA